MSLKQNRWIYPLIAVAIILAIILIAVFLHRQDTPAPKVSADEIPPYAGEAFVVLNDNIPAFTDEDLQKESFEFYSALDRLGRCGYAVACISKDLMPTEDRESISHIKPSGWKQAQYPGVVDGSNLYNRCHMIGFQLTGENDNERNLITGTRYMNVEGMLPFENMVADYIKETGNRVLYRVTPVYSGNNLVADGVKMEAKSIEDDGDGICFCVFVYNCQPGVTINYADGSSKLSAGGGNGNKEASGNTKYVVNESSKKFHTEDCSQGDNISAANRKVYEGDREDLIADGYSPAGCCKP